MATVDSNGIIRVEASDDVAPLHPVLNSLAQSVSNAFNAETRIYPVANAAGRTAKVAEIGVGNISASRPLFVWRADAPTGRNLEYTVNGSTWLYYSSSADDTGWVDMTPGPGFSIGSGGRLRYRRQSNRVTLDIQNVTRATSGAETLATAPGPGVEIPLNFGSSSSAAVTHAAWINPSGLIRATWQAGTLYRFYGTYLVP